MHESDQPAGETDELDTTPVDDDVVVDTESAELELDELNDAFATIHGAGVGRSRRGRSARCIAGGPERRNH